MLFERKNLGDRKECCTFVEGKDREKDRELLGGVKELKELRS